jgi:hypothetical protein
MLLCFPRSVEGNDDLRSLLWGVPRRPEGRRFSSRVHGGYRVEFLETPANKRNDIFWQLTFEEKEFAIRSSTDEEPAADYGALLSRDVIESLLGTGGAEDAGSITSQQMLLNLKRHADASGKRLVRIVRGLAQTSRTRPEVHPLIAYELERLKSVRALR